MTCLGRLATSNLLCTDRLSTGLFRLFVSVSSVQAESIPELGDDDSHGVDEISIIS